MADYLSYLKGMQGPGGGVSQQGVSDAYKTWLGRDPGEAASGWVGQSPEDVFAGILGSQEYRDRVPSFVESQYQDVLGRPSEPGGFADWSYALSSGQMTPEEVGQGFLSSPEYLNRPVPGPTASPVPGPAASPVFDMPTITPDSGTTTSNTVTGTTGQTASGIDWGSPGVAGLLDQIKGWISRSSGLAQNAQANIGNYYNNLMRESLGPQAFQGTLNNLRSRNMLNSSVASDALATAQSNIAGDIGNRAFDTYLKGYDTQMQMPNMLAQLANALGGQSTTSTDPMAVYRLLFDNII